MSTLTTLGRFAVLCFIVGGSIQQDHDSPEAQHQISPAASDFPVGARVAVYSPTATPGFDSPEAFTAWLEQRWSLSDIRAFCIPARRHKPLVQNLVPDSPEFWKGRLYAYTPTGFDQIWWYATVDQGRMEAYSLNVDRGDDSWLLEIRNRDSFHTPPDVTPDPSQFRFIGDKGASGDSSTETQRADGGSSASSDQKTP
jgi:hypothetical protein